MRLGPICLLVALLPSCGSDDDKSTLTFTFRGPLPGDGSELIMNERGPRTLWRYRADMQSHAGASIRLRVAFVGEAPEGMTVALKGQTELLPHGSGELSVVFVTPPRLGRFTGRIRLYCDELPEWSEEYPFHGEVIKRRLRGRYLNARPGGVAPSRGFPQ